MTLRDDFRGGGTSSCVLLTGTPLQNNTRELFSLLHFAEPAKFSDADAFAARFGTLSDAIFSLLDGKKRGLSNQTASLGDCFSVSLTKRRN